MPLSKIPDRLKFVDPKILREVAEQCDGDWSRVVAESPTQVVVHNTTQIHRIELPPVKPPRKRGARHSRVVRPPEDKPQYLEVDQTIDGWFFTAHVAIRMNQRGISIPMVLQALSEPDESKPSAEATDVMNFRFGHLRVTANTEKRVVITATWDNPELPEDARPATHLVFRMPN